MLSASSDKDSPFAPRVASAPRWLLNIKADYAISHMPYPYARSRSFPLISLRAGGARQSRAPHRVRSWTPRGWGIHHRVVLIHENHCCTAARCLTRQIQAARRVFRLRVRPAGSSEMRTRIPVALAMRSSVEKLGFALPLSSRAIVDCEVPIRSASCCCERLALVRASMSKVAIANSPSSSS